MEVGATNQSQILLLAAESYLQAFNFFILSSFKKKKLKKVR